ncbi:BZ3500_MvSof-1268-A1-R1_Chr12-3g04036 [Microbotryum saponariae]|uniref:D-arabinono-1,4-lactone oxidase n=1 Tax=Microbotryum saponariae TaxID=289078 RepID=A0A2X0KLQ8_9BASI|nr:BZ3500_MvSof-1268-A1-R1_Chr12-3g04036 [Microbotryum saponariae]SDA02580.1 BZ3501_MvSof-1269-A2-R1_Chr12-3g03691 [Microbotryum saponariae]
MGPVSTPNETITFTDGASLAHLATSDLIKLVAPIRSLPSSSRSIFTNWATTYSCQTLSLLRPTSVDEVRYVVELARREGVELRASGSGHSPSDLVCTEGYIINLDRLDHVLEVSFSSRGKLNVPAVAMLCCAVHPTSSLGRGVVPSISETSIDRRRSRARSAPWALHVPNLLPPQLLRINAPLFPARNNSGLVRFQSETRGNRVDAPAARCWGKVIDCEPLVPCDFRCRRHHRGLLSNDYWHALGSVRIRRFTIDNDVDTTDTKFHAEGGIKLSALHPILHEHDLAISSLGSISDQTLAGCLSTATHGSGVNYGNLSSCVDFFELVLPTPGAPLVRVSKEQDSDLFYAAACGLGLVGVIVGVGMRCERAFNLEEELWTISFADFVERWQEIAESAEHVRCWWFPQVGQVKVSRLNRTDKPLTALPSRFKTYWFDVVLAKHFHAVVLAIARFFPNILPYHAHVMWALVHRPAPLRIADLLRPVWPTVASSHETTATRPTIILDEKESSHPTVEVTPLPSPPLSDAEGVTLQENIPLPLLTTPTYRVASSVDVFNYDCGFPQYTYEGAVPYTETGKCLESLSTLNLEQLYDRKGLRSHFPIEIRYTAADDVWLSPTYGQRATYIGAIQYRPFNLPVPYKKLFKAFESVLLQHGGRPHWAKSHTVGTRGLENLYPKFGDFLNVRERVDPQGVLLNAYARRHLLGQVGEEVDFKKFKKSGR